MINMKNTFTDYVISIVSVIFMGSCTVNSNLDQVVKQGEKNQTLFTQSLKDIGGDQLDMSLFKSKSAVLFVNIATKCGYTEQLKGLEALYQKYKEKGLVVVGLPSNDFGGQTPEDEKGVKSFCKLNYGVSFPLSEKIKLVGSAQSSFSKWLVSNSKNNDPIKWNFEKFLVNKDGVVVKRFGSAIRPFDEALISETIKLLL